MSLFSRYIFRQATGALMLILLSLTGVVWIALALKQLKLVTTKGQETLLFFKMTLLALPNLMALIAPIALLIAAIHVLSRLNGDSELIVMSAGGATIWRFARPLLLLALIVSVIISFVNHFAMPWSMRQLRLYITQVNTDLISQVLIPGKFSEPQRNLTIHIRERGRDGELYGIMLHDERKPKQMSTYLAERGRIIKDDTGTYLLMANGHILRKEKGKPSSTIVFESFPIDLSRMERKNRAYRYKPRERYYDELMADLNNPTIGKRLTGKTRSEFHERFVSPFYPFVFVLVVIAFVGQAQTTRQNRVRAIILAFVFAAGTRLVGLASMNLVAITPAAVPLAYAIPLAAIGIASIAAQLKMRPRKPNKAMVALGTFFDMVLARIRPKSSDGETAGEGQAAKS